MQSTTIEKTENNNNFSQEIMNLNDSSFLIDNKGESNIALCSFGDTF